MVLDFEEKEKNQPNKDTEKQIVIFQCFWAPFGGGCFKETAEQKQNTKNQKKQNKQKLLSLF